MEWCRFCAVDTRCDTCDVAVLLAKADACECHCWPQLLLHDASGRSAPVEDRGTATFDLVMIKELTKHDAS